MGKRPRPGDAVLRLGAGDSSTGVQRRRACYWFLEAATGAEPRILCELRDRILPSFWQAGETLDATIEAWLERWRIQTPWSFEWAFALLGLWMGPGNRPPEDVPPRFCWPSFGSTIDGRTLAWLRSAGLGRYVDSIPKDEGREAVRLDLPECRYDPFTETKADAVRRLTGELTEAVRAEVDRIARESLTEGDAPTIVKTTGREHFEWLARYQVKGDSYAGIAHEACRSRQAVKLAIRETAELIGLVLRAPDPPGRPRKPTARIVKVKTRPESSWQTAKTEDAPIRQGDVAPRLPRRVN
jgi:hypothetical protein